MFFGALYFGTCVLWFIMSWIEWDVQRTAYYKDEEKIRYSARRVLNTPIWPLWALKWVGNTIADLQKDVMK
jgi:hypothetical protein